MRSEHYLQGSPQDRRSKRRTRRKLLLALTVVSILLVAWLITLIIEGFQSHAAAQSAAQQPASETQQVSVLAPIPFENVPVAGDDTTHSYGPQWPTEESTLRTLDYDLIRLPACGQVDTGYFADAAFLGDSITEGFTEYGIDLSGALICGYVGGSPNQVVNRTAMKHPVRGSEVPLEVLAEARPAKLYVLMGANTLTATGNDESFLAYYEEMIKQLRETLPDTILYLQALTPVRPEVVQTSPGLDNARLRALNQSLSAISQKYGCAFIDLQECFADADGNLDESIAQPDGIHITVAGYQRWISYLCSHTLYRADNPWLAGSAYAAG